MSHTCVDATAKEASDDGDGSGRARRPGKGSLEGRQGLAVQHIRILKVVGGCHAYAERVMLPCGHTLQLSRLSVQIMNVQLFIFIPDLLRPKRDRHKMGRASCIIKVGPVEPI